MWGSSESSLAIARIFTCDIVIMREGGFDSVVYGGPNPSDKALKIVYSGPVGEWNHYSSFNQFDSLALPVVSYAPTTIGALIPIVEFFVIIQSHLKSKFLHFTFRERP